MRKFMAATVFWAVAAGGSAAWAGIALPVDVPEPGVFGIVAAGAAAVILAARLHRRK